MPDESTTTTTGAVDASTTSSTADAVDVQPASSGDDAAYWKAEAKKVIRERDEYKTRTRELEVTSQKLSKAEAKRLAEAGQWQELATKHEAALAELTTRHDEATSRLETFEQEAAKREAAARAEAKSLRSKLPKEVRDVIPDAESMSADAELRLVRGLVEQTNKKGAAASPTAPAGAASSRDILSMNDPAAIKEAAASMDKKERAGLIGTLMRNARLS